MKLKKLNINICKLSINKISNDLLNTLNLFITIRRSTSNPIFFKKEDIPNEEILKNIINQTEYYTQIINPEEYENLNVKNFYERFKNYYFLFNKYTLDFFIDDIILFLSLDLINKAYNLNYNYLKYNFTFYSNINKSYYTDKQIENILINDIYINYYYEIYEKVNKFIKDLNIKNKINLNNKQYMLKIQSQFLNNSIIKNIIVFMFNEDNINKLSYLICDKKYYSEINNNLKLFFNDIDIITPYYKNYDDNDYEELINIHNILNPKKIINLLYNPKLNLIPNKNEVYNLFFKNQNNIKLNKITNKKYFLLNLNSYHNYLINLKEYFLNKYREIFNYNIESYYDNLMILYFEDIKDLVNLLPYEDNLYFLINGPSSKKLFEQIFTTNFLRKILKIYFEILNYPIIYPLYNIDDYKNKKEDKDIRYLLENNDILIENLEDQYLLQNDNKIFSIFNLNYFENFIVIILFIIILMFIFNLLK